MADTSGHASSYWHYPSHRIAHHPRIAKVSADVQMLRSCTDGRMDRWLLDTDQDAEGMRVIADLYGAGDPHNRHAKREFREIKEAVMADVSLV